MTFDNESAGAASYFWLFGDGQTSTETNPIHDYGSFGTYTCLLYTSDAADERSSVDLGGRRIIKKKKKN